MDKVFNEALINLNQYKFEELFYTFYFLIFLTTSTFQPSIHV
jgi:hypothetical protein